MNKVLIALLVIATCATPLVNCARPAECELPPETGPCRAMFPSFYFNPSTEQCQSFVYGGCSGNDNRFKTEAECLQHCSNTDSS